MIQTLVKGTSKRTCAEQLIKTRLSVVNSQLGSLPRLNSHHCVIGLLSSAWGHLCALIVC